MTATAPSPSPLTSTPAASVPTDVVRLDKYHALGNDFLVAVDPPRPFTPADAIAWCDRTRGIGADGLISATPADEGPRDAVAAGADDAVHSRWVMVLHNRDGSRAELSGNGLRCLGQAIASHTGCTERVRFHVDTDGGPRTLDVEPGHPTAAVTVGMGAATTTGATSTAWSSLGIDVQRQVGVDVGNPHLVALVDSIERHDAARFGPIVEADHGEGINVHLVDAVDRSHLRLKVWERGVGVTEACGTGATAAAFAARSWGLVDGEVDVEMPGGAVTVTVDGEQLLLTGPSTHVATVLVPEVR